MLKSHYLATSGGASCKRNRSGYSEEAGYTVHFTPGTSNASTLSSEEASPEFALSPLSCWTHPTPVRGYTVSSLVDARFCRSLRGSGGGKWGSVGAYPFKEHDELQFEKDDGIDRRATTTCVGFMHELTYKREVECSLQVTVKVILRHQFFQGHIDERGKMPFFRSHHGSSLSNSQHALVYYVSPFASLFNRLINSAAREISYMIR
jgi:hypothetical protein